MAQSTLTTARLERLRRYEAMSVVLSTPVLLGAIVLLGSALRLYYIGHQSLWLDEGYSYFVAKKSPFALIRFVAGSDNHPPLHFFLLHYWLKLGDSEASLRLLSAVAGIGSIIAMFKLGEALYDTRTGLVAALLVAVSPFLVWYSQEARMYALLLFFTLVSTHCLVRATQTRERIWWGAYILSTTGAIYTNYGAFWYIFATSGYFALRWRRGDGVPDWLKAQIGVGLLFLPWLPAFVHGLMSVESNYWLTFPTLDRFLDVFRSFNSLNFPLRTVNLVFFSAVLLFAYLHPREDDAHRGLLSFWLFGTVLVPLVASLKQPIFLLRNLITACAGYYLLAARVFTSSRSPRLGVALLVVMLAMNAVSLDRGYFHETKEQWREAAAYVQANAGDDDLVLLTPYYVESPFRYYAGNSLATAGYPSDFRLIHPKSRSNVDLEAVTSSFSTVWLVRGDSHGPDENVEAWLDANASRVAEKHFVDVSVIEYAMPGDTALAP